MVKSLGRVILMLFLGSAAGCTHEPMDVAVVDLEQAFQRSPLAMASAIRLNTEFAAKQRELKNRGRQLAEWRQQLDLGTTEIDTDRRAALETQIASGAAELADMQTRFRADLEAARKREGDRMIEIVTTVAREIAEREGLTLLLEKKAVIYARDEVSPPRDITELVIRELLDRMNPTEVSAAEPTGTSRPQAHRPGLPDPLIFVRQPEGVHLIVA